MNGNFLTPSVCGTTFDFQSPIICHFCLICSGCICTCTAEGKLRLVRNCWSYEALSHESEISNVQCNLSLQVIVMCFFSLSSCSLNWVLKIWSHVNVIIGIPLHTFVMKQQLVECCEFSIMSRFTSRTLIFRTPTDFRLFIKSRLSRSKHSF